MSARDCDARTHGNVTVQLLLDQFREGFTDGTLVGPTSDAWLDHWRIYLENAQGVEFRSGKLIKLEYVSGRPRGVRIIHELHIPDRKEPEKISIRLKRGDYVVVCLPVDKLGDVFDESLLDAVDEQLRRRQPPVSVDLNDLRRAQDMAHDAVQAKKLATPTGQFRHFTGIQFFFEDDIFWVEGHTYYPDSPWGLSSICQTNFRMDRTNWESGYRGIFSVDIGALDQKDRNGNTAWGCTKDYIAREVWKQIKLGTGAANFKLPDPIYYHIDDHLLFNESNKLCGNSSPFLMPQVGTWDARPGEPGDYNRRRPPCDPLRNEAAGRPESTRPVAVLQGECGRSSHMDMSAVSVREAQEDGGS